MWNSGKVCLKYSQGKPKSHTQSASGGHRPDIIAGLYSTRKTSLQMLMSCRAKGAAASVRELPSTGGGPWSPGILPQMPVLTLAWWEYCHLHPVLKNFCMGTTNPNPYINPLMSYRKNYWALFPRVTWIIIYSTVMSVISIPWSVQSNPKNQFCVPESLLIQ